MFLGPVGRVPTHPGGVLSSWPGCRRGAAPTTPSKHSLFNPHDPARVSLVMESSYRDRPPIGVVYIRRPLQNGLSPKKHRFFGRDFAECPRCKELRVRAKGVCLRTWPSPNLESDGADGVLCKGLIRRVASNPGSSALCALTTGLFMLTAKLFG